MAVTSFDTFVDRLHAMAVTGVTRSTRNPPDKLNPTDCPWKFIRMPSGQEGPMTADGEGGWPTHRAEVVILVEPVLMSTQPANFDLGVDLIDNLSTAFRATKLAQTKNRWTIRLDQVVIGESVWWALVAAVEANG